jgi:uncharacterized protein (TIGR02646 family)
VARARSLWDNKKSSTAKRAAFVEIEKLLKEMAVGLGYCCYCEHGEVSDIEHIYPKSLFPNKAFEWGNYLYACKKCNTGEKLDHFSVFIAKGTKVDLKHYCKQHPNKEPSTDKGLLIHLRRENPMRFLVLDLFQGTFTEHPNLEQATEKKRATYTLRLLRLNEREELIEARKNAGLAFFHLLKDYIGVQKAKTLRKVETILEKYAPKASIEFESTAAAKKQVLRMLQERVQHSNHQTVWKEIQRQSTNNPRLEKLFNQLPEALTW